MSMLLEPRRRKTVAILQSSYIPWKGYFDIIRQVDEFILLDSVQYTRRDWRNRNRIKTKDGLKWLSIPVNAKGRYVQPMNATTVSDPQWAEKHWATLQSAYARAPYFAEFAGSVRALYAAAKGVERLSQINFMFLSGLCPLLGIATPITWDTDYPAAGGRTERLVALCRAAGATTYLSGPSAKAYIENDQFDRAGIALRWMEYAGYPEYPQLHPPFEHAVSVLDLLFHTGREASAFLERRTENPAREASPTWRD